MAGLVTNEGKHLLGQLFLERVLTDRDADLELGLFTNVGADATLTYSAVTEPTGTGYARITLTDGSWTGASNVFAYAQQTFTGGAGGWTGTVKGYFVASKSAGGTRRILFLEVDPNGPYTINQNDTYKITPGFTFT